MSRYLDLLERTGWTFVQAALAAWFVLDIDLLSTEALKLAAVAGAIAAAKAIVAFQIGSSNTAATLPAGPDTDLGGDAGHADYMLLLVGVLVLVIVLAILGVV